MELALLVWPPEPTCRDLAGLEILMGFRQQVPFSQPIQVSELRTPSDLDLALSAIALALDTHSLDMVQ
jgi:hypothetical protein